MLLHNARLVGEKGVKHIHIKDGIICEVLTNEPGPVLKDSDAILDCSETIVFPGLINSHDHLDFNLFPRLRSRIYNNYTEWGNEIHSRNRKEIEAVLKVPEQLRIQWGVYKNLLNGVTTVVNHGKKIGGKNLITIFEDCYPLHSVAFEKNWKWKLNSPFRRGKLIVMHVGEGKGGVRKEIDKLQNWNFFRKRIVGVHGVAMTPDQAKRFAALVWCPDSNFFLLGKTAYINLLKKHTRILFGTDSTLTAHWNIWEHLRLARNERELADEELFDAVTISAAEIWALEKKGKIAPGMDADLVIARGDKNSHGWDSFYSLNPGNIELIIHQGEIIFFDLKFMELLGGHSTMHEFFQINLCGVSKYVKGDLPGLINEIRKYYPQADIPVS
jgi:cytosine/adenosine deaminase-related metal-dependent hydrolase